MVRHFRLAAALVVVLGSWAGVASAANFSDFRALWISRFDFSPYNASNITTIIDNAASMGITDVVWQVRGRADAFYNGSIYEPKATAIGGLDPLQVALDRAHSHGMNLHAWVNALPLWNLSSPPSTSTVQNPSLHPFNEVTNPTAANPGYRVIDNFGNPEPAAGWSTYSMFNPVLQPSHDHINDVVRDIATRYDVDGIHLDYIRYGVNQSVSGQTPFNRLPHDDLTHQMYHDWAQQQFPNDPSRWDGSSFANATPYRQFIRERLTDLVGSIRGTIDDVNTTTGRDVALSAAVWRDPDIGNADYMQDYRTWLERDYLDIAMPMIYLSSGNDHLMEPNLQNILDIHTNATIAPGLGVYLHTASGGGVDLTITQLQRAYDMGAHGVIFYHYPSFYSGSLAAARRTAVNQWYADLPELTPTILADFEVDQVPFGWPYNHSPSSQTFGLSSGTTIERVTGEAHEGTAAQQLNLVANSATTDWQLRHNSGDTVAAHPSANEPFAATGFVGFWLKSDTPGVQVQIALDDPNTAELGHWMDVVPDGRWHLYEWDLDDNWQWTGWVNGNGAINGPFVTLDSIFFRGTGDALVYLDSVAHNPHGSLLELFPVPGDFNGDGVVDIDDYHHWRAAFGESAGTGVIDAADFTRWRNNLGYTAKASFAGESATLEAVPEPNGLALLAAAVTALAAARWPRLA